MNDRYNIPDLEKVIRILEHLVEHQGDRSLRELVEDPSISKTGIYRIATGNQKTTIRKERSS